MRLLEIWVATPLARALGWTLLHSLWEGALLSAALAVVLGLTRSARARYAAACAALLSIVAAISVTFVRLLPQGMDGSSSAPPFLPAWNAHAPLEATAPAHRTLAAAVPWLAPLWMLGVWIFVLAQVAGWISVSRLRTRGVCCAPERWQNELLRLRERLRLSRPVQLLESCLADVPMVVGHIRPLILMPIGLLAGLPARQVEVILLHELAHIRRCDYLVNVLQRAVESLLFYHPAVWWISRVIRAERENCCDDMVVSTSGNAQEYAFALTAIEEHRRPGRQAALAATGGNLVKRIHRLLYPQAANAVWAPLLAAIILTTTAVAAFAAWPAAAPRHTSAAAYGQKSGAESQYLKWLNEDVVYIVTPEERAAFGKLKTDAERKKFVEQFWERRNPHPGSADNTYKQRYYHELAYANQHFAANGKAGWQTDRGHMLILYGPPDQIDSHTNAKPYAYEEWMYRHIQGVGNNVTLTFIDRSGEGDYQLAPGPVNNGSSGASSAKPAQPHQKNSSSLLRVVPASRIPQSGKDGYSYPKCVYCPAAQYAAEARAQKVEGILIIEAVITPKGRAEHVKAINRLPYGLTENAVEAVKKWRFKPATGPDGKPAAVRQMIEVGFHMYS
jgi:TonB family protein